MSTNFGELLVVFQANMWPVMEKLLAEELGGAVTQDAVHRLGVGYYPAEDAWVFPERDESGFVIGLTRRYRSGKKAAWKGGQRGLSYECVSVRQKGENTLAPRFIRVQDAGVSCPICELEKRGCLVSDEDPEDPRAVICVRTPAGAVRHLGHAGYLHHRKPHSYSQRQLSILPASDRPVVITEGASDALTAMSIGYVAVGVASAGGNAAAVRGLTRGQAVIIVGDRDQDHNVGQAGLEGLFLNLKAACTSVVKVLPPVPFKDLRAWAPTQEQFENHAKTVGDTTRSDEVLDNDSIYGMVGEWLARTQTEGGIRLLQCLHGDFYQWDGALYQPIGRTKLTGLWYEWFEHHKVQKQTKEGVQLVSIKPNRRFIQDVEHAACPLCEIDALPAAHEPLLVATGESMDLEYTVAFRNGLYYPKQKVLVPLTPDIFLTSTLPYNFDPRAKRKVWDWAVADWFSGAQDCIDLLQEWMGYCLIASNRFQSMMFFFGRPGSGKSTVANVISHVLGSARICSADTSSFTSLFGLGKLLNKYLAIMAEHRSTSQKETDKLLQAWKAITGGDVVNVNRRYRESVDARLFCRLLYVANDALPFDDASQAMARRTNLLYFPNMYCSAEATPDLDLENKLLAELPGIAVWALDGLTRLLQRGAFTRPKSSAEHLDAIRELTSPICLMLEECCEYVTGAAFFDTCTDTNRLYDLWVAWCKATNTRTYLNRIAFGMKLRNLPNPLAKTRVMERGQRRYVYKGFRILPAALQHYLGV